MILTSDHGESLGEHGIYFDHHGLYEVSLRVPLILYSECLGKGVISGTVTHADIVPTILDVVGVHPTSIEFDGISLLSTIEGKHNLSERPAIAIETYTEKKISIKCNEWKLILSQKNGICNYCGVMHGDVIELYNIKEDPNEVSNIAKKRPEIVNELKRRFIKDILKFRLMNLKYKASR